jgi:hypothetical protein
MTINVVTNKAKNRVSSAALLLAELNLLVRSISRNEELFFFVTMNETNSTFSQANMFHCFVSGLVVSSR